MSKRVFRDRQITDYDSDDPYSAFRRPKKRKKIRKDQNKEKNEHPRQIVEDENRELNWKECFWSKKYSKSQLKEKLYHSKVHFIELKIRLKIHFQHMHLNYTLIFIVFCVIFLTVQI